MARFEPKRRREDIELLANNEIISDYGATTDDDFHKASHSEGLRNRFRKRQRKTHLILPAVNEKYESLNYELPENELQKEEERSYEFSKMMWQQNTNRWIICFLIGFFVSIIGVTVQLSVEFLNDLKFAFLKSWLQDCYVTSCLLNISLIWAAANVCCVIIASMLCVLIAPVAYSSGISQIKSFLNGIKVPDVLRLKTGLVKIFGLIWAVTGGLIIGKEGPMIHTGAIIGGGLSQGKLFSFAFDFKIFEYFRSDREKRDFVSAGTAAGVAAAFNAPIGGVLFAMEEGASFWTQPVTWRTFFCSMSCYFFFNSCLSQFYNMKGSLSYNGLADFGLAKGFHLNIMEVPIYLVMGVIGGLSGVLFNALNTRLAIFRMHYITRWWHKVMEAMFVAFMSSIVLIILGMFLPGCQPLGTHNKHHPVQLFCPDGYYSEAVYLVFQTPENAVKSLFHYEAYAYQYVTLFALLPVYWILTCWTYGISVPSGIFVPQLLIGACWGRIIGMILAGFFPDAPDIFDPSKYAIIGAAAQLGGVVRMTISLCVILMESVQSLQLGLPLMLVLIVAKFVGDRWNKGIYDIYIELAEVPLLPWEPPTVSSSIPASRVMSAQVRVIRSRERVNKIYQMLKTDVHHGYPIVSDFSEEEEDGMYDIDNVWIPPDDYGHLEGFITREQLIVLLHKKVFWPEDQAEAEQPPVALKDFRNAFPRYDNLLNNIELSDDEKNHWMDLRPFMDKAPYCTKPDASLRKLFSLFRQLGLRHSIVINDQLRVVGIVTRKDVARFREEKITEEKRYGIREVYITK